MMDARESLAVHLESDQPEKHRRDAGATGKKMPGGTPVLGEMAMGPARPLLTTHHSPFTTRHPPLVYCLPTAGTPGTSRWSAVRTGSWAAGPPLVSVETTLVPPAPSVA